jgi:4-hydroxybenzoate polyprenyltransferase
MKPLQKYASFIKLEHTLFSLPLLFAGAVLAEGSLPSWRTLGLILIAGAGARTVALVLNRVIDRHIDRENPRTQERHLASGKMKLIEAYAVGVLGLVVYVWAAQALSDFCLKLSWIPLVAFTAYPYFKRITPWTHVGLGLVWSLVPLAGFFAVKPSLDGAGPVFVLAVFSVFWLAGFDIIYATLDEEFDRRAGVRSLPAHLGSYRALKVSALFHLLAFFTLIFLYGFWLGGPLTVMLLAIVGVLLFLEQYFSAYVDFSFFHVNIWIGVAVLVFIMTGVKGV